MYTVQKKEKNSILDYSGKKDQSCNEGKIEYKLELLIFNTMCTAHTFLEVNIWFLLKCTEKKEESDIITISLH